MTRTTRTIHAVAEPEEVFRYIVDRDVFNPPGTIVEAVRETPEVLGNVYTWTSRMLGMRLKGVMVYTEYVPNQRLTLRNFGGLESHTTWTVEPERGGSKITVDNDAKMGVPVLGRLIGRLTSRQMDTVLQRAKAQLEGAPAPVPARGMLGRLQPPRGTFANGMRYARFGDGPRSLLWLGGFTRGLGLAMMTRLVRPFVAEGYSVWLVSWPPNLPNGYTLADLAADYATLITEEFGGHVDVVIGHSTDGLIGFCLAAGHPDRFGHIVIAGAGLWSEWADRVNLQSARLAVAGRINEAGATAIRSLRPDIRLPGVVTVLGALMGRVTAAMVSPHDLLVSAEAMHAFDPQHVLPQIRVPVLLVAGERDEWFTNDDVEQAAKLIPHCTMKLYPGKTHFGAIASPRFATDVRDFVRHHPPDPSRHVSTAERGSRSEVLADRRQRKETP